MSLIRKPSPEQGRLWPMYSSRWYSRVWVIQRPRYQAARDQLERIRAYGNHSVGLARFPRNKDMAWSLPSILSSASRLPRLPYPCGMSLISRTCGLKILCFPEPVPVTFCGYTWQTQLLTIREHRPQCSNYFITKEWNTLVLTFISTLLSMLMFQP